MKTQFPTTKSPDINEAKEMTGPEYSFLSAFKDIYSAETKPSHQIIVDV